jgi:serine/threonine protein kinase
MNPLSGSSASSTPPTAEGQPLVKQTSSLDLENLASGKCWRGAYQIGEQLSDVTYGKVFKAQHIGAANEVVIRSFRVNDTVRSRTWEEIRKTKNSGLLGLIEGVEADGRRIEVIQAPPSVTLREWIGRRKPNRTEIELIVRQLSQSLSALHKQGIVHLNVRPDTIFVRTTEGGLNVLLGGFETATLLLADGTVDVSMDPFYAPPEALGLYHYSREPGLRAWDWWSLGRVIQEAILGRHILGHILERDVTRETPDLRKRAENLLKDQDQISRAGAVEKMPAMDRELTTLLRGLLTCSKDGRWRFAEIEDWLRKEPVKDRYDLPHGERLFIWNDRAYTVSEAAEFFSSAKQWEAGVTNLFDPTNPSTLAHFINVETAQRKTKERFEVLIRLGETPALQQLPPDIVRSVVMAVVLKFLTGHHAPLILRGSRIDEDCLKALLTPDAQPIGLGTVYGFTARSVVQQIEQFDVDVARMLGDLGRIHEAAIALAQQNNWLPVGDLTQVAKLIRLCLEPETTLSATREAMIKLYACSRDRTLDKLFKKPDAGKGELVVIAFTGSDPKKFSYVTHREWNQDQYRVLSLRGEQLATAGLWLHLGYALKVGPLIFGRLRMILPIWLLLSAVIAFVGQNILAYAIAGAFPFAVFTVRMLWLRFHRAKLQGQLREKRPWTLRSGWTRCRDEALTVLNAETAPTSRELAQLLTEANDEIGKLTLDPPPKPIPHPPLFMDTRIVALSSWLFFLALLMGTIWYGVHHPPKIPQLWLSGSAVDEKPMSKSLMDLSPAVGVKSVQTTLEELRRAKRETDKESEPLAKISWPFKTPLDALVVRVHESSVALPEQIAVAEEMAELLVNRYDPKTINAIVAVQVPTEKGVGLMLYDGRTGKVSDRKVYTIGFVPFAKSWIDIDSRKAIFLGGL